MDNTDDELSAMPDLQETFEVVGYGPVRRARGSATEVQLLLQLAPVRQDGRFEEGRKVVSRWIGVGQLPLTPIGSRWRHLTRVGSPEPRVKTATVSYVRTETIGRAVSRRDPRHYPFDSTPETPCYRLQLNGEAKEIALVPVVEVLRAVFGCRSGFLRQLFDGQRDPVLFPRRFLFDRDRSCSDAKRKTVDLWCHSKPTEREAYVAASIMTSEHFRRAHDGVFARLQGDRGFRSDPTPFVDTPFPFGEPIGIAFEDRFIEIEPGSQRTIDEEGNATPLTHRTWKRRLITRILAYDCPTDFDTVSYDWLTTRTRADLPPREGRTLHGRGRQRVLIVTGAIPGTLRSALSLSAEGASALAAKEIMFISRPRLLGDRALTSGLVDGETGEIKASTADARPDGDDDVAYLEVESKDPSGDPAAGLGSRSKSFVDTDGAIRWLLSRRNWTASGLAEEPGLVPPLLRIGTGEKAFSVVEFEILTDGGPVLIVEAGSIKDDRRALGLVVRTGMKPFEPDQPNQPDPRQTIRDLVFAERARWNGRKLPGFVIGRVVRGTGVWDDRPWYAGLIETAIARLVAKASLRAP